MKQINCLMTWLGRNAGLTKISGETHLAHSKIPPLHSDHLLDLKDIEEKRNIRIIKTITKTSKVRKTTTMAVSRIARANNNPFFRQDSRTATRFQYNLEKLLGQDWATSLVKEGYTPEWTSSPPLKVTQISS